MDLRESYCLNSKTDGRRVLCRANVADYISEVKLVFHSLVYKLYWRVIPMSASLRQYDLGTISLEKAEQDLTVVDIVSSTPSLAFTFKMRNISSSTAFITAVQFLFYRGNAVAPTCDPSFGVPLYRFPLSAIFGNQKVKVSAGRRLNSNYRIPRKERDAVSDTLYITNENAAPYLVTLPLKLSQKVVGGGVDEFTVRFDVDNKYAETKKDAGPCWYEIYQASAIILYNEGKRLVTRQFQVGYYPGSYVLPSTKPTRD
jgi:hypothetical protein